MDIADMRMTGMTMLEIGKVKNLSRERIRQILITYFFDIEFPKNIIRKTKSNKYPVIDFICKNCGIVKQKSSCPSRIGQIFCKTDCYLAFYRRERLTIPLSKMTKEQYREWNNKRCNEYYKKHCHEPRFREKIREANRKYKLKRNEKNTINTK